MRRGILSTKTGLAGSLLGWIPQVGSRQRDLVFVAALVTPIGRSGRPVVYSFAIRYLKYDHKHTRSSIQ